MSNLKSECKYFNIHSIKALENGQYSIVLGNVENTEDRVKLAISLYPSELYYIEYCNYKVNMGVLIS